MRSNCLLWAISKRLTGGKLRWSKSKTWIGFHVSWVDKHQSEWEYTLRKVKKQPWWYIPILYNGTVKRVINYDDLCHDLNTLRQEAGEMSPKKLNTRPATKK